MPCNKRNHADQFSAALQISRCYGRYARQTMKYLTMLLISLMVSSCASYKVETSEEFNFSEVEGKSEQSIELKKTNDYPQGGQCFEPMLFVLTLGIIPTHCVDDYNVAVEGGDIGKAKVTMMSGWFPLFLALSPSWKYGVEPKIEKELIKKSENR